MQDVNAKAQPKGMYVVGERLESLTLDTEWEAVGRWEITAVSAQGEAKISLTGHVSIFAMLHIPPSIRTYCQPKR